MEEKSIPHFRKLWNKSNEELKNLCCEWEMTVSTSTIPEDALGEIRTTIGLANLLMNQKLKQFKDLIEDSVNKRGEKEITCSDLQGFWDMVYFEVEKIQKKFENLNKCKQNEWKFEEQPNVQKKVTSAPLKKSAVSNSHALAARQRIAEAKRKMQAKMASRNENFEVEIVQKPKPVQTALSEKLTYTSEMSPIGNAPTDITNKKIGKSLPKRSVKSTLKNKENMSQPEDLSTPKLKSNLSVENKKKKDYGTLQCVTRSAKKALLMAQHENT